MLLALNNHQKLADNILLFGVFFQHWSTMLRLYVKVNKTSWVSAMLSALCRLKSAAFLSPSNHTPGGMVAHQPLARTYSHREIK